MSRKCVAGENRCCPQPAHGLSRDVGPRPSFTAYELPSSGQRYFTSLILTLLPCEKEICKDHFCPTPPPQACHVDVTKWTEIVWKATQLAVCEHYCKAHPARPQSLPVARISRWVLQHSFSGQHGVSTSTLPGPCGPWGPFPAPPPSISSLVPIPLQQDVLQVPETLVLPVGEKQDWLLAGLCPPAVTPILYCLLENSVFSRFIGSFLGGKPKDILFFKNL